MKFSGQKTLFAKTICCDSSNVLQILLVFFVSTDTIKISNQSQNDSLFHTAQRYAMKHHSEHKKGTHNCFNNPSPGVRSNSAQKMQEMSGI